uniref:Self-incompatibility locus early-flowering 3 n=1 Tax=Fagopyrum esculentum subsp. esculentum TaxID=1050352 RepID=H3K0P0_FAGES|nr:self-incompatibility locus early-flowering 3 [Fagopyrum esculentum subsp. esculentum]
MRLHLKTTEKGGPKPPPRNKMAVHEEPIASSSRFSNGSITMMPLHPIGGVPISQVGSSQQVNGIERKTLSAFYSLPASTHRAPRIVPLSESDRILSKISENSAAKPLDYTISSISCNSLITSRSRSTPSICPFGSSPLSVTASIDRRAVEAQRAGIGFLIITDNSDGTGNNSRCLAGENYSMHPRIVHRNEDGSGTRKVGYVTSVRISPDDVVLKIGQENFWKIRRILVKQQRIFSIQVFELHRLVQKSLAGSSHHYIKDSIYLQERLDEVSSKEESLPPQLHLQTPPPLSSLLRTPLQPSECPKIAADSSLVKTPFPPVLYNSMRVPLRKKKKALSMVMANKPCTSFDSPPSLPLPGPPPPPPSHIECNSFSLKNAIGPENSVEKRLLPLSCNPNKLSFSGHQSGKSMATSVGTDKSMTPYGYSLPTPPGDLALTESSVPCPKTGTPSGESLRLMLPTTCFYSIPEKHWPCPFLSSEGLVYKPYPGPYPPNAASFTTHLFGSCGPMIVRPGGGSYIRHTAYGIPHAAQQGKELVPGIPIKMSFLDPCDFSSTNLSPWEHEVVKDMSSSHQKGVFCSDRTVPRSNEGDRQGSTGSSSVGRGSLDTLHPFPLELVGAQELESGIGNEKLTRAIKAVPCDGRLASESAMKIFRSIQKERKQNNV